MKNHVLKIDIEASVGGYDLAVQEAVISLGVNAIPEITLNCAPKTALGIGPLNAYVLKPTIEEYAYRYRRLAEQAEGLSVKGDVDIRVTGDMSDSISLKGWILSGVGLSGIGSIGAPHLSVVMQHPICQLTKVGSIYETPKKDFNATLDGWTENKSNFLEIIGAAYDCLRVAGDDSFYPCPPKYDQPKAFRQALGRDEFDPRKYLVWKNYGKTDIFLSGNNDAAKKKIAQAIGRMAFPDSGGSSTWDLIQSAAGTLLLTVVQDDENNFETEKLVIQPLAPWNIDKTVWVYDDQCEMTEVPGQDPFRLIGVMATKFGAYSGPVSQGLQKNGNPVDVDPIGEILYVPTKGATFSDGRIMKVRPPSVLNGAYRLDAESGETITQGMAAMQDLKKDGFNGAIGRYCQAVYECSAASMMQATAMMPLIFKDEYKDLILPGKTLKLKPRAGSYVYLGYIMNVVHSMSVNGGNSTTVRMSYVRPGENFSLHGETAIESSYTYANPAYDY